MPEQVAQPEAPVTLADVLAELRAIRTAVEGAGTEAEGLSPAEAARYLGISATKLHAMNNSGELGPEAVGLGCRNCPRYIKSEMRAWLLAGAPTRPTWKQLKAQAMRRAG